jgi:hypothetical protein
MTNQTYKGLWVDDLRPLPSDLQQDEWMITTSFHTAIVALETIDFKIVSLDHDIASFYGNREMTGYDIICWLVARKMENLHVPSNVLIHSANPVGKTNMAAMIDKYLLN